MASVVALLAAVPGIRSPVSSFAGEAAAGRNPFRILQPGDPLSTKGFEVVDAVDPDLAPNEYPPGGKTPAMAGSRWYYEDGNLYNVAQGWALSPDAAWRPVNPYRLLDFESTYLNVTGGTRRSWQPPACSCRRLRIWMYGGSTTYGLNQRDEHTIPSALARAAHREGISLDIENRGASGHLHWMEAERFAWDLTLEDPPDLVVFYDGANESWAWSGLDDAEAARSGPPLDPTLRDLWASTGRSDGPPPDGPPGSAIAEESTGEGLAIDERARATIDIYDRSRALSRATAEAHGVPVAYLWQPTRFSRPLEPQEPHASGRWENASRLLDQRMQAYLPEDVGNVADAMRGTPGPLFVDDVHHNEEGARLVGERIFVHLEARLRSLIRESQGGS